MDEASGAAPEATAAPTAVAPNGLHNPAASDLADGGGAQPMAEDAPANGAAEPGPDLPEMSSYSLLHSLAGHERAVASVKFARRGCLLASASADKTARLWDAREGRLLHTLEGHAQGLSDVAWNRESTMLATASDDCTLRLWDAETGQCLNTLPGHTHYVFSCCFSAGGNLLASGSFDETIRLWDVRSGKCLKAIPGHSDPVNCVDFSCDEGDPILASSSFDGLARLWKATNGKCLRSLMDKDSPPVSFARFTPNSKYLLVATLDSRLSLWDFENKRVKKTYTGHKHQHLCLQPTFLTSDPSGTKYVVCGSEDHAIYFWELNQPKSVRVLRGRPSADAPGNGHFGPILSVAAHPTQPLLASAGYEQDRMVKVWQHTGGGSEREMGS